MAFSATASKHASSNRPQPTRTVFIGVALMAVAVVPLLQGAGAYDVPSYDCWVSGHESEINSNERYHYHREDTCSAVWLQGNTVCLMRRDTEVWAYETTGEGGWVDRGSGRGSESLACHHLGPDRVA